MRLTISTGGVSVSGCDGLGGCACSRWNVGVVFVVILQEGDGPFIISWFGWKWKVLLVPVV